MTNVCRVLIEAQPHSGAWNMAVDEVLLEAALERGVCTLRWYRWAEPTVSLGYFQEAAHADPRLAGLPRVRRLSGGGAILHHHEWTYSCAVPAGHPLIAVPGDLYAAVHEQIIAVLRRGGVAAHLRGESWQAGPEPFLCFGRGDARDIVCGGQKVVGSAQRRRRGAVLQHGSVLLRRSPFAPDFPGIEDQCPEFQRFPALANELAAAVGPLLGSVEQAPNLTPAEQRRAAARDAQQYRTLDWHRHPLRIALAGEAAPPTIPGLTTPAAAAEME